MENPITLKKACKRFNKSAKAAGLGRRTHYDIDGLGWPFSVTQTDNKGRDQETHGFHSERDAVQHVMNLAVSLELYTARPEKRPAACQPWPF